MLQPFAISLPSRYFLYMIFIVYHKKKRVFIVHDIKFHFQCFSAQAALELQQKQAAEKAGIVLDICCLLLLLLCD
jgi:hypothetical protein